MLLLPGRLPWSHCQHFLRDFSSVEAVVGVIAFVAVAVAPSAASAVGIGLLVVCVVSFVVWVTH